MSTTKEQVKEKIKNTIDDRIVVKRFIYYIFDDSTKNALLYQDTSLSQEWTNPDTKELITLKDVAFYYDGIPVYITIKEFNMSVGFDLETHGNDNKTLVMKGYTPYEMEAVLTSQTTNRLFRTIKKLDSPMIIAIFLSWVICILATVLTCTTIFNVMRGV